jgi:hypothetical protein
MTHSAQRHAALFLAATVLSCTSATTTTRPAPRPEPEPAPHAAPSTAATLGIPPGHLPPPGQCRVWIPGTPPGHQAPSSPCRGIERHAPAASWIVYRPTKDKKVVHVRVVDERRAGVIVRLRVYDAKRGTLVRETGS